MGMKYIIVQIRNGDIVCEWPIIFPDMLVHRQIAETIKWHLVRYHDQDARIVAAGSASFFGGKVRCFGESETLNVESRGNEDVKLIKMFDYLHGIV